MIAIPDSVRQRYTQQAAYLHAMGYSRDSIKSHLFEAERLQLLPVGLQALPPDLYDSVLLALARQVDQFVEEYLGTQQVVN